MPDASERDVLMMDDGLPEPDEMKIKEIEKRFDELQSIDRLINVLRDNPPCFINTITVTMPFKTITIPVE